jgi:hypothetical protein
VRNLFTGNSNEYQDWDSNDDAHQLIAHRHFCNLENAILDYYGADGGDNTFKIDDVVFKVLEDPNDGYRSMLGAIEYTGEHNSIFFSTPIARVKIVTYENINDDEFGNSKNHGYRLIDVSDGHVWLEFGTHNYDDYYPYFVFRHFPKEAP